MKTVFLGIGTNLGSRERNITEAIAKIELYIGEIVKSSSVYETEPWGFKAMSEFLNIVIKVETRLTSSELMERILMIESKLGRKRGEKQYSSRMIDIDILFYGNEVINEQNLKIPHPRLQERRFVLVPLCEIEPEMRHPVIGKTLSYLLESCTDKGRVHLYNPAIT